MDPKEIQNTQTIDQVPEKQSKQFFTKIVSDKRILAVILVSLIILTISVSLVLLNKGERTLSPTQKSITKTVSASSGIPDVRLTITNKQALISYLDSLHFFDPNTVNDLNTSDKKLLVDAFVYTLTSTLQPHNQIASNGEIVFSVGSQYEVSTKTLTLLLYISPDYLKTLQSSNLTRLITALFASTLADVTNPNMYIMSDNQRMKIEHDAALQAKNYTFFSASK